MGGIIGIRKPMQQLGQVIGEGPSVSGSVIAFATHEGGVDKDLNGDGDKHDSVIQYIIVQ
jgi:hypothetical protein